MTFPLLKPRCILCICPASFILQQFGMLQLDDVTLILACIAYSTEKTRPALSVGLNASHVRCNISSAS